MFDTRLRRHPVQTFQFWFVVLTSFAVVTAWKMELFSFRPSSRVILTEEPMPPPPSIAGDSIGSETGHADDFDPAPDQLEFAGSDLGPTSMEQQAVQTNSSETQTLMVAATTPVSQESAPVEQEPEPISQESDSNFVRTASIEKAETADADAIVQVSAEILQKPEISRRPLQAATLPIDLAEVDRYVMQGQEVAAQRLLSGWYWKIPEARPQLLDRLNILAGRIYFQSEIHYREPYKVQFGDRLETIAAMHQLTPEYLMRLNRLKSPLLKPGQLLKVIQGPFSAIVDVSDLEMTIHAHGYYVASFQVGFGTDQSIPQGTFQVTDKVLNPDYYGPAGMVSHTDPANPLGKHWMTINDDQRSLHGFGIHSCRDSALQYTMSGPGCLRLGPQELAAAFDLLMVGSEVSIRE